MTAGGAQRSRSARILRADGLAHTIQAVADLRVVAVFVIVTYSGYTRPMRVALRARWTAAGGDVRDNLAKSVASARCSQGAWILAVFVDAALVERAVIIRGTFS